MKIGSRSKASALLVSALVACSGCGGGGNGEAGEASEESRAGRTLAIMGFGPGDEIANSRAAIATKALAPAKVRNPRGAYDDQKFLATLAAGNPPDVVYLDRQKVGSLAASGALEPLSSCIEEQDVDTSQYLPAALQEVTYDDEIYALPEFSNQRTLIVNDTAAAEAGLDPSQLGTTDWDQLRAVNKRLLKASGGRVTRIGFDPKIPEFFPLWAKANGVDLLSEDGRTANLDDSKAIEALEFTVSLIEDHGGWDEFKAFRDTWDFFGEGNQVAKNQIGFWPMESWYYNVLSETSPDAKITAVAFTDRNGEPLTFLSGNGWAIPKGAKNPDLGCTWMKTMTATETWLEAARTRAQADRAKGQPFTGLYTANREADRQIAETIYEPVSEQFDEAVQLLVDVQEQAFALPASPAGAEFNQAMTDAINRVLVGQQTAAEALKQAQRETQAAIDEAAPE
jgi:multiple sugar transport system substrate-binding protein